MDQHTTPATPTTTTPCRVTPAGARCAHYSHPVTCGRCQLDRWRVLVEVLRPETYPDGSDGPVAHGQGADAHTGVMEGYVTLDVESLDPSDPASASVCLEPLAAVTLARQLLDMAAAAADESTESLTATGG